MAVATTGGLLSGNILAGASWNSLNSALPEQLTAATGQATSNYAVGGATTADTLNQLNTFIANGGAFDPNATVFLQTGGVDFLQGIDKATIKDNINQIVKILGDQGVNVVLTGSPYAASIQDVIDNNFDPKVDPLFNEIAKENKNVALVGTQGEILQNKKLLVDALHTNAEGTAIYNQSVIDALSQFKNEVPPSTPQAITQAEENNVIATPNQAAKVTDYRGVEYDKNTLIKLAQQIAPTLDKNNLAGGVYSTTNGNIGFAYDEATNALGYKPTAAEQVVLDMARHLIDTGVTDLNQVQAGDQNQRFGSTYTGKGGTIYEIKRDPTTGEVVTSTWGKTTSDKGNIVAALSVGAGLLGLPTQVGTAILGAGASPVAASALGGALLGGTTAALTDSNILKGALLGGAGGAVSGYLQNGPIDASNMTSAQFNDALEGQLVKDMQLSGLTKDQISGFLDDMGIGKGLVNTPVAVSTPVADAGTVAITAPTTPSLNNVLNTIASTTPAVTITGERPPQQTSQDVVNLINSQLATNVTKPANLANVEVTSNRPVSSDVLSSIATIPTTTIPKIEVVSQKPVNIGDTLAAITTLPSTLKPTTADTNTTTDKTKETDPLKVAQLALTAAGLLGAGSALSNSGSGGTQYPIIPVPSDWQSPPKTGVAAATQLPPINFGDRNLLIGTQWEKFLDPNYGKVPEPVQYSQPSNLSYNDLMGILGSKQGMPPASSLSINDIISGIQNQYAPANVPSSGSNYRANLANVNTGANATMLPSSVMQTIAGTGANTGVSAGVPTSTKTGGSTIQNIINTIQGVPTQTGSVANAGMFQKVYDPTTGREFNSPAQAAQYGVTNYVTEMPFNQAFMQTVDDTTKNTINSLMAKGQTFEQALDSIGSRFGMTGKQFYNSEVQGGLNYADQQVTRGAVATESGGLSPDELISKLEAYKAKPPTTAQEFADQRALYADYANRYANSSYNYANMGGKPQDFSLKPAEFLPTSYTGYVDPINQYLSSTNQMTPTFTKMQDILSQKPDINLAFQNVLAANPNAFTGGNSIIEATINNLSSAIDTNGLSSALRNFYKDQQNLIGFGSPDYKQIQNMSNPQYAALQKQIMDQTQRVDDTAWNTMAQGSIGRNKIDNIWRDPVSGLGIGTGQSGLMYFDRDGRPLSVSGGVDLAQNAAKYGIDTSGFTGLAKTI